MMGSIKLTTHQEERMNDLLNLLEDHQHVRLIGSAGVGKTFCMEYIGNVLENQGYVVFYTAPTNKATQVLYSKVASEDVTTIHKFKGMQRRFSRDGIEYFAKMRDTDEEFDTDVLIVDEASMVGNIQNHPNASKLLDTILDGKYKIIFVGDDKQLNPVNEEDSPAFLLDIPEVRLEEIVRQKEGSSIIDLSYNLDNLYNVKGDNHGILDCSVIEILEDNNNRYLCWTNNKVVAINKQCRQQLFGKASMPLQRGERLIFRKPFQRGSYKHYTCDEIVVDTLYDSEIEVRKLGTKKDKFVIPVTMINGYIPIVKDKKKFEEAKKHLDQFCQQNPKQWWNKARLLEQFANLRFSYALTVHQAQGSTFKEAILDVPNINWNKNEKERKRLLYTGVTRASDYVHLIK